MEVYLSEFTPTSGIIKAVYLRYFLMMICINIQEVARKKGIKTAYQFQKLTGFAESMAARIFKGKWTRIDLNTMNTICNSLKCTPNDILVFTPDD